MSSPTAVGTIRELWRYPVKSMGGEPVTATALSDRGLAGDLAAPPGTFFDAAPLHFITDRSLAALATRGPGRFAVGRFRPNVMVTLPDGAAPFAENDWLGRSMAIGASVVRIIDPSPRCVVTTLATGDVPRDPTILKAIVEANSATSITLAPGVRFPGVFGGYARVEAEGTVRVGEALGLAPTAG